MTLRAVSEIDDVTLMLGVQRRDEAAFEMLYWRHASAVHAVVYRTVSDPVFAEEITQTTFLRLWERSGTIDATGLRLRPWLVRVALNAVTDEARRRRPTVAIDEVPPPVSPDVSEQRLVELERRAALHTALGGLPDDQREAVDLAYFGGLTQAEIAQVLDQPLGTIKGRIRLAMQKLRSTLGTLGENYV
jgi:RNA polymerase sigma-70 factor (ECF subfamily)